MPPDAEPAAPWIQLQDVSVTFDGQHQALTNVGLEIQQGEFVALVGPSGCGKSTLLRLVARLQSPTTGRVGLGWQDDPNATAGFVFQQPNLLPWRNVLTNIELPLELRGVERTQRRRAAERARELVRLAKSDETKLPRMLSGGMKMRVSVARALVTDPIVMLMDEPFAAVDDLLRTQLNEEVVSLWQNHRWTTLFVTHNISEAILVSQRVVVMSPMPGRIVDSIPILLPYPRNEEMRGSPEFAQLTQRVSRALRNPVGADV